MIGAGETARLCRGAPAREASMYFRLRIAAVLAVLAAPNFAAAQDGGRRVYSPAQYLKNFALSACIAEGYGAEEVKRDGNAAAGGYRQDVPGQELSRQTRRDADADEMHRPVSQRGAGAGGEQVCGQMRPSR